MKFRRYTSLCLTLKDDRAKNEQTNEEQDFETSNKKRHCVNYYTKFQIFETLKQLTIK